MPTDVVGVTLELLEIQIAVVVETKAIAICVFCDVIQNRIKILNLAVL
jgi:hypothetical protein